MPKESPTYFADTTVVYYRLDHGHPRLKLAARNAAAGGQTVLSNFVRGEYIRGFITGLIELFFAIKQEDSVVNGMHWFSSNNGGFHPRRLSNAWGSTSSWLCGFEDWQDVTKTLRRLGEYIRSALFRFDAEFPTRVQDPLRCEIGIMSFPKESYRERHISDFYDEFTKIQNGPTCDQCAFRSNQLQELQQSGIDLHSDVQKKAHAKRAGYVAQAKWMDKAEKTTRTEPTCWYCDRMGDTIIALSAPADATIVTGDRQSFPTLAQILSKKLSLIPSLSQISQQQKPRSSGAGSGEEKDAS